MEDKGLTNVIWILIYCIYPVTIVTFILIHFTATNFPKRIPGFIRHLFYPGKLAEKRIPSRVIRLLEIPKRWFVHFYIVSALFNGTVAVIIFLAYGFHIPVPNWIITTLDFLMGPDRKPAVHEMSVIIAACLNLTKAFHRIYECLFISIYSDSKINVLHYAMGHLFYTSLGIALLSHAPGFTSKEDVVNAVTFSSLRWYHLASICLACWAIWQQTRANIILADLRKNDRGKVVNMLHSVPYGGWFEMVTCPHYLAEIIFYTAVLLALEMTYLPYWILYSFVFVNQTIMARESLRWYRSKYRDYPKNRKAIIPYIL